MRALSARDGRSARNALDNIPINLRESKTHTSASSCILRVAANFFFSSSVLYICTATYFSFHIFCNSFVNFLSFFFFLVAFAIYIHRFRYISHCCTRSHTKFPLLSCVSSGHTSLPLPLSAWKITITTNACLEEKSFNWIIIYSAGH